MQEPAENGRLTLAEFMTDGSLAGVCAALSDLTGETVELLDERGRRVVRREDAGLSRASGEVPWVVLGDGDVGSGGSSAEARVVGEVPIVVSGQTIGSLRVLDGGREPMVDRGHLLAALSRLSRTAGEFCESTLAQRRGLKELGVLFELTGLLVDSTDDADVLRTALEAALRILGLDAGSIVLLPEDADGRLAGSERDLEVRASVGLSESWLESDETLSHDRAFDRMALEGEVVVREDLRDDPSVRIPEQVRGEGVVSFVCAGMRVQGVSLGVVRLYGRTRRTFSDTERRLIRSIAQQAGASVHLARLLRLRDREREYERQLRMAREIQQRMLPSGMPRFDGLQVAARYQPSFEVGGDFYDVFEAGPLDRRKLAFVVGDVVGKGMPAAMLMASVRTSLRAHADSVSSVEEVMERVNRDITRDTRVSEFATMWFGVIDPVRMTLRYTSAGHQPTFIVREREGQLEVIELSRGGLVVGIDAHAAYGSTTVRLEHGDAIVAYTDGVDEAMNFAGERFGRSGVHEAVRSAVREDASVSAGGILEHLFWTLRQYAGLTTRPDDATAVVIRVEG